MNHLWLKTFGLGLVASIGLASEPAELPTRYQVILDRSPFGAVQGAPSDTGPSWITTLQFIGTVVSNSGEGQVQVIIQDKSNNKWQFRAEGEALDGGISVVRIYTNEKPPKVVLKKELETGTLTFPDRATVASTAPGPLPPGMQAGASPGMPQLPGQASQTTRRIPFRRGN